MAYGRRYLAGQQATTVMVGEGAITSDKIVDKAVITRTIDDQAVGAEQIHDESILSQDIKDGEVKTSDIADASITTPKIPDGAVTREKLADDLIPSTRPFSPGVATAEIADAAVTAGQLAADSVETLKVKDLNITTGKLAELSVTKSKLATGSVDTDKLEAAAVDVTKLKNLSVNEGKIIDGSVTENKIGALAVSTGKVKDRNITGAKIALGGVISENLGPDSVTEAKLDTAALSARHKSSFDSRVEDYHEDFGGNGISNRWVVTMDAGGVAYPEGDNTFLLYTGAVNGNSISLAWGGGYGFKADDRLPRVEFFLETGSLTYVSRFLGLFYGADDLIGFVADDSAGVTPNWKAKSREFAGETLIDTGIPITAEPQLLMIEFISDVLVNFYIDGDLVAEITTHIPGGSWVKPRISLSTNQAVSKLLKVKSFSMLNQRVAYA